MAGSLLEFPTSVSSRSFASNLPLMRADLVEQAAQVIPDPPVLINMVSKRVKQLALGRPALVERRPGLREADIALLEIIQGKIKIEDVVAEEE
jgi:DNA-directed RNA polymerase subunit omega